MHTVNGDLTGSFIPSCILYFFSQAGRPVRSTRTKGALQTMYMTTMSSQVTVGEGHDRGGEGQRARAANQWSRDLPVLKSP